MSIYTRIFVPFVFALIAGSLGAWWIATTLIADALSGRVAAQLERAVDQLASGRLPLSPDLLARLETLLGTKLVLIPTSGHVPPGQAGRLTAAAIDALKRSPAGKAARYRLGDTAYSLVVRPIGVGINQRYRALAAATPLAEIDIISHRIAALLGITALAGTLLLAWVAHLTARGITRPIAALARLADRLATGDLLAHANAGGPRELVALGATINHMAEQLDRYQAKIAERNRLSALGEMASRIAHEIRNPLTAIKLHVELLAEATQTPAEAQTLATVLTEIKRLELVVSTTLSLGRPAAARFADDDLNALVDEVTALVRTQLTHRQIRLDCRPQPLPRVALDRDRLKQVLLNLLNNAADELPDGGRILVTTELDTVTGDLLCRVEDSGPGVASTPSNALPMGHASSKPHGLGLGLQISREIVAEHGGSITAERSERLGGARFVVRLPSARGYDVPRTKKIGP